MDRRPQNRTLFRRPPCGLAGATAPTTRCACHRSAGDHSPRPVPAPHRPSRAPAFPALAGQALTESRSLTGGQTRVAFPGPGRRGVLHDARSLWQGPSPLPQRYAGIRTSRGPKPPASARPAHGGRFAPAGPGAGLRCSWTDRSTGHRRARAGETRCVSCSRPNRRRRCHRCNGRGHRPCQSAAPGSGPAGGQSPRPAPDPPPAGASRPPGRALAFRGAWTCRSAGHRPARAGKRGSRLLFPPGGTKAVSTLQWQGPSPLPQRRADP